MKHFSRNFLTMFTLFICFCSCLLGASFCKTCNDTVTAVKKGDECTCDYTTKDENGKDITSTYTGVWGSTVEYKKCKFGLGICADKDMKLTGKCAIMPNPYEVVFINVIFNVSGCSN